MACKPKPQLRMADGGELMRRFANRQPVRMLDGTPENMAQNTAPMSAQDAGAFAAMGGPQGVAPDAPAAAPAADPGRRQRMLDAGQRTQTFNPMMNNIQTEAFMPQVRPMMLRDGGTVPGKGSGDKIPALYEPGEFVVSNDMLNAEPGLREQLHDLRGNVLAAKGKTVAEADAQAVKGGTLRAASGGAVLPELPSLEFLDKRPAPAPAPAPNLTAMNQPGADARNAQFAERSAYEAQAAREANPRSMTTKELFSRGDGSVRGSSPLRFDPAGMGPNGVTAPLTRGGTPFNYTHGGDPVPAPAPTPGMTGPLRDAYGKMTAGAGKDSLSASNRLNSGTARVMGALAPYAPTAVAGAGAIPGQLNVGEVLADPNTSGMDKAANVVGQQVHEGKRLAAGATGGAIGGALGMATAPFTGPLAVPIAAVGAMAGGYLGTKFNDAFNPESNTPLGRLRTSAPVAPTAPQGYTPRPDSVEPWGNEMRRNAPMAGIKAPTAPVRGVEDFTKALRSVPDQLPAGLRDGMVYKTKDAKGNVTYSGRNVTGDVSGRMLNGDGTSAGPMRGSLRVSAGAPTFGPNGSYVIDNQAPTGEAKQAQINATLRNPDGGQWSARDNAVMAANLRDGVDPMRGTSRQPAQNDEEKIPAIGEFGHNRAVAAKAERDRLKATLRGQDINMQVAMAPAKLAAANRDLIMQVMGHKSIGNDPARGAAYLSSVGRPDLAEGLQKQADATLKMTAESDTLVNNKWKDMQDQFKGQYMNPDKNGTPEANAGLESRTFARAFARLKRTNPEAFRLDPTQRSQAIRDAIADEELMGAFGNPQDAGFASMLPEFVTGNRLDDRTQFKGQYMNPDKNGTPEANAGLESRTFARAFARLKRTNPEAFRLDPTQRSQAIRDAIADEELMGAFGNPQDAGFASMLPEFVTGNRLDDRTHEIPGKDKLRGTQISDRVGGLRGALSPSLEGGDYMLRTPAGRQTLNLGKLSADAKARLQRHIDDSNK